MFNYEGKFEDLNQFRSELTENDRQPGDQISIKRIPHRRGYVYAGWHKQSAEPDAEIGTIVPVTINSDGFPELESPGNAITFRMRGDFPLGVAVKLDGEVVFAII